MTPTEAYEWLRQDSIKTGYLSSMAELTAWDQRTYISPKGHRYRSGQLAVLASLLHERSTNPRIGDYLNLVEDSDIIADPTSPVAVNIREWRRSYDRLTRIPKRLAEELARATSEGETAWEEARAQNDWANFQPHLECIVGLLKEKASALGYEEEPYDALIEDYELGETAASMEQLFTAIKEPLVDLIEKIKESRVEPNQSLIRGTFDIAAQEAFSKEIAQLLGFDFQAGRLDISTHPFTIGVGPYDIRITTRYDETNLLSALLSTIHEAGHAIYEQGLPKKHFGTPMGHAVSLGIHESQSRLFENFIGRSKGFWQHTMPMAKMHFPSLASVSIDDFLLAVNEVRPSLIRVEADEVTYNLHIVLRFELELALMRGDLSVGDLPDAWNEKMKRFFGLEPPDAARGVMQDVHWSAGLIGYFPTYTLGNIYAAQLFYAATDELGDLNRAFEIGEFESIFKWLRRNVHEKGSQFTPRDLIREATGTPPDPSYLILYSQNKFSPLYNL